VLHAARLLDVETGKVIAPGEVLVRGDRIAEVGVRSAGRGCRDDRPGRPHAAARLIDAHVHLFLHPGAEDLQTVQESVPQRTITALLAARDDLMAGSPPSATWNRGRRIGRHGGARRDQRRLHSGVPGCASAATRSTFSVVMKTLSAITRNSGCCPTPLGQ